MLVSSIFDYNILDSLVLISCVRTFYEITWDHTKIYSGGVVCRLILDYISIFIVTVKLYIYHVMNSPETLYVENAMIDNVIMALWVIF